MSIGNPILTGFSFYLYDHKIITTSFTLDKCCPLRRTTKLVLSLWARLFFTHPLFRNDSEKVFQELSKGLVGSKYAATIARFRDINGQMGGRGAYFAAETQHAGQAVWGKRCCY